MECGGRDARAPCIGDTAVASRGGTSANARPEPRESAITIPALRLKLDDKQATATLTETQNANPQVLEATLEGSPKGPVGIVDFGTAVTVANFFVRE